MPPRRRRTPPSRLAGRLGALAADAGRSRAATRSPSTPTPASATTAASTCCAATAGRATARSRGSTSPTAASSAAWPCSPCPPGRSARPTSGSAARSSCATPARGVRRAARRGRVAPSRAHVTQCSVIYCGVRTPIEDDRNTQLHARARAVRRPALVPRSSRALRTRCSGSRAPNRATVSSYSSRIRVEGLVAAAGASSPAKKIARRAEALPMQLSLRASSRPRGPRRAARSARPPSLDRHVLDLAVAPRRRGSRRGCRPRPPDRPPSAAPGTESSMSSTPELRATSRRPSGLHHALGARVGERHGGSRPTDVRPVRHGVDGRSPAPRARRPGAWPSRTRSRRTACRARARCRPRCGPGRAPAARRPRPPGPRENRARWCFTPNSVQAPVKPGRVMCTCGSGGLRIVQLVLVRRRVVADDPARAASSRAPRGSASRCRPRYSSRRPTPRRRA